MRTTIRLDESLLRAAKTEAHRRGETVTALIDRGLRLVLAEASRPVGARPRVSVPVSRATGGTLPGVDLDNSAALLDAVEGRR